MKDRFEDRLFMLTSGFLCGMFLTGWLWSAQVIEIPRKCNVVADGALVVLVCVKEATK